jgi:hypothetical protein
MSTLPRPLLPSRLLSLALATALVAPGCGKQAAPAPAAAAAPAAAKGDPKPLAPEPPPATTPAAAAAPAPSGPAAAASAPTEPAAAAPGEPSALTEAPAELVAAAEDPAAWPPEIAQAYAKILALPGDPVRPVTLAVRALASHGKRARAALDKLARQSALPEPHRALSAIALADSFAFDLAGLTRLLEHPNVFGNMAAAAHLADFGGPERRAQLDALTARVPALATNVRKTVAKMAGAPRGPARAFTLLEQVHNGDKDAATRASAVLVEDHPAFASWAAEKLVRLMAVTRDTQMLCGIMLARIHATDVTALTGLTDLRTNKFVRLEAFRALSKLGAPGRQVLEAALKDPKEPLRPHLQGFLADAK